MATILLSAAGAAIGSGFGGSILGLSGAVIGRAVGATLGRSLDQRILGSGSEAVEVGKVDRFRLSSLGYGTPVQEVWGRMRVSGEIIWASRFQEQRQQSGGGKGAPRATATTTSFSYSVSLAIGLCRGAALRVGRVWADGVEIAPNSLDLRFYPGSEDQLPDPKIAAVEGIGLAPSYRGICYVVIENLPLARFGNRVPQFSFEVVRRANVQGDEPQDLVDVIRAVALIPGSGEYALATTPVHFNQGPGRNVSANVHSVSGVTDFSTALKDLNEELPNCGSVALVVSWFGSDLRCGLCQVRPKVEQQVLDSAEMPWKVSGVPRTAAAVVPTLDGRPIYGGTPTDRSVIEAIQAIRAAGKEVMFYPFILMDQVPGNGLPDPWSDAENQPALPWRGRISLSRAPGLAGSPDQTSGAGAEVAAFLGTAGPADFATGIFGVTFSGTEWSFRRFILHYAHLCALAGGVDAFCIGSELRGLTQIRSNASNFPMVQALKALASEVRGILGAQTKISYAADWSEYFGLHMGGDVLFNLDPLWSDPNIDFIGIDNYMPISDWRDGSENLDGIWASIYDLDYLEANVAGGEGYDWFYDSVNAEEFQRRTPISDGAYGEDWLFRYKDIKGWWSNEHFDRPSGVRQLLPTGWVPGSKPIRFTEYGCAALDKATNQPNKFIDHKSSESSLPRGSNGNRDDYIQIRYYLAQERYWRKDVNNPAASLYSGRMVDFDRSHAWAWDARPFPNFPGDISTWSDGLNYAKGHWLNGRTSNQQLSQVVAEICQSADLGTDLNSSQLHGSLHGFTASETTPARSKLQSLFLVYGADTSERYGALVMANRSQADAYDLDDGHMAVLDGAGGTFEKSRNAQSDAVDRVRLTYVEAENDFGTLAAEAVYPGDQTSTTIEAEASIQLTEPEANAVVERWLAETVAESERIRFAVAKSKIQICAGDLVTIAGDFYRVERIEDAAALVCDAVRVDMGAYSVFGERGAMAVRSASISPTPVFSVFMDLPILRGDEDPYAPHVAVAASPWPGPIAVWSSATDTGYQLNVQAESPAIVGTTLSALERAPSGLWDNGSVLIVDVSLGGISAASRFEVLNGANLAVIGDQSAEGWEVFQFSDAVLTGTDTYQLRGLLRGLAGSDATMPSVWPSGSLVVLLDGLVPQIQLPSASRGLGRYYRLGLSENGYTGANVVTRIETFNSIGLRPYSVAHLNYRWDSFGNLLASWIRRTRIDGDNWSSVEVPLGEASETYTVIVSKNDNIVRQVIVTDPSWTFTATMQAENAISAPFEVRVAQNSSSFGAGPFRSVTVL